MLTALIFIGLMANSHRIPKLPDPVKIICRSTDLEPAALYIQAEVGRHYPGAIVYLCHGAYDFRGVWTAYGDKDRFLYLSVQTRINTLRVLFPNKKIIVWVCNERGEELKGKGVYYFKKKVWVFPNNQLPYTHYSEEKHAWVTLYANPLDDKCTGNIEDLVESK